MMMSSIPYGHWTRSAFLFLVRSGRSTFALSLMVIASVSTLIFLSSLAVGVNDAMIRNSVGLFSGHILAARLPPDTTPEDLKVPGTKYVLKRIHTAGIISFGSKTETIDMISIDPQSEGKATAFTKKIVKGRNIQEGSHEVLLSEAISKKLGIAVGEILSFSARGLEGPVDLIVSGIYKTGIASMDTGVAFCPYNAVLLKTYTWDAAVFVRDNVKPEAIVSLYKQIFDKSYPFTTWKESMPDLVQLINLNYLSMSIVIVLVFGVVSLGIACAFVVFIFRSLREYGIMKAMGVTSGEVACLIIMEIVLINIVACLAGGILGVAAVFFFSKNGIDLSSWTSHNQYFVTSGVIFPRLTVYSLISPPVACLAFGLISAVWPALLVARKKAVDILKVI
jgi:ABC-type lipoprotein release transport system permease subunit